MRALSLYTAFYSSIQIKLDNDNASETIIIIVVPRKTQVIPRCQHSLAHRYHLNMLYRSSVLVPNTGTTESAGM